MLEDYEVYKNRKKGLDVGEPKGTPKPFSKTKEAEVWNPSNMKINTEVIDGKKVSTFVIDDQQEPENIELTVDGQGKIVQSLTSEQWNFVCEQIDDKDATIDLLSNKTRYFVIVSLVIGLAIGFTVGIIL